MNLFKLMDSFDIDGLNKEEKDVFLTRKEAFGKMGSYLKKASIAALPASLITAVASPTFAQSGTSALDVLIYAHLLENLEYYFYAHAMAADNPAASDADALRAALSADETAQITLIRDHEEAHRDLLAGAIESLGGTPATYEYDQFNFRARPVDGAGNFSLDENVDPSEQGLFENVYSDKATFYAVAQAFEDTGVRAYKGQAGNLMSNDDLLTTALQIHSIEARHAAYIRHVRLMDGASVKEWVSTEDYDGIGNTDQSAATAAIYANEDNITHLGVDAVATTTVDQTAVEEAYDETLSMSDVTTIVTPFAPFAAG